MSDVPGAKKLIEEVFPDQPYDHARIAAALNHPDVIDAANRVLTVGELIEKLKAFPQHYHVSHQLAHGTKAMDLYAIVADPNGWPIVDFNFQELPF